MAFASVVRAIEKSPLTKELLKKLHNGQSLLLSGISRLPKGIISSSLAKADNNDLLVICSTLEEAGRWAAQLEAMGWQTVNFYPTSEASPYSHFDPESEITWGQLSVISYQLSNKKDVQKPKAIVATERSLQPHLPPPEVFQSYCLTLEKGMELTSIQLDKSLARLGYERVSLVEIEGQWSKRGDIIDIFPVSAELPVRLEWFGDELEQLKEFDPSNQRSLDKLEKLLLTPSAFSSIIANTILENSKSIEGYLSDEELEILLEGNPPEGMRRFLGVAFDKPASIIDYLSDNTLIAIDELEQCQVHSDRGLDLSESQWFEYDNKLPKIHDEFQSCLQAIEKFDCIYLSEIAEEKARIDVINTNNLSVYNLQSRPIPTTPHQFAKIAGILRGKREVYSGMILNQYQTWLVSAQPTRTASLLQEHDCPVQFIPNNNDFRAIEKSHIQQTAVALKYSGLAELEGFILPTYRIIVVTDKEFFGQQTLATSGYIRKRRRAASKKVDLNKLRPGDYVVHKHHGLGKFLNLETLIHREYLVVKYADGTLRVPADSLDMLTRFRQTGKRPPELNKMAAASWSKTKTKVKKNIKKLAVDLLKIYAQRSKLEGYAYPPDNPWQQELEDSFPYQPTPDQLKATQDIKIDLESDRPMDRLVCGDVGFGKTEVAIRAIFKVITTANKQVAFLAPTTILTQQHYHTLKERFAPYPINVGLLNRFRTPSERKEIMQKLVTGELDVVVGTQQLLNKDVKFKDLGMLVVDEEQRFGVNQKEKIKAFKSQVDVLTLSATPIPRTLYMSLSGIREMSLITTPPPSRRPIKTHLSPYNPEVIRNAIRNELDRGGQVFYVVPRVAGIEEISAQIREMIPNIKIAIAHGQMPESELESTMLTFSNGEADLLVCTTIIESGLDIPRVNTIVVEDSQKFGLSQLYQLRGRVGRAGTQAHAWLLYPSKHTLSETARKRLRALQEFSQLGSGYQLATRDMEIRGVGSLLGAEQSGQITNVGFDLYMEMLQEAIHEIQGQEIPKVEDTQVDLKLTSFIPEKYIADPEQKMDAYRAVATATSKKELVQIAAEWQDRYGAIPSATQQLIQVMELKQIAKAIGFSRVKPEGKQNIVLETPMGEPAWNLLAENLPQHVRSRFVYASKKVVVRGLGVLKPQRQLNDLIDWLGAIYKALPELELV
ncbi:transcription-repair coupling factor [Waterburya agarophytonicola K14]|uniref:Transcription-repair-coupling factor n=1 Tax=Waterburya agarophytonicola KI4 TaxID=2874699 RepID=A0A964BV09_9CYAN|nr:transcription-repair coupling factor [Waterburya agarophytonicola]MCC0178622.1 transcription-repair coupling factor [Waterburya agarophytonicola KI4]